jgi:hypothetical protein
MERVFSSNEFEDSRICLEMLVDEILLEMCFEVKNLISDLIICHRFIGKLRLDSVSDHRSQ